MVKIMRKTNIESKPIGIGYSILEDLLRKLSARKIAYPALEKKNLQAIGFRIDKKYYKTHKKDGKTHRYEGYEFLVGPTFLPPSVAQYVSGIKNHTEETTGVIAYGKSFEILKSVIKKPINSFPSGRELGKFQPKIFEKEEEISFTVLDAPGGQYLPTIGSSVKFRAVIPNETVFPIYDYDTSYLMSLELTINSLIEGDKISNKSISVFDTRGLEFSE